MPRDEAPPPSEPQRTAPTGQTGSRLPGVPQDYRIRAATRADQPNWQYPYVVQRPGVPGLGASPGTEDRPSRMFYQPGDELKPAGLGAAGVAETKRKLVLAGYLDIGNVGALGVWNDDAVKAYQAALVDANRMGMSIRTLLHQAALTSNPDLGGGGGGGQGGRGGGGGWAIDPNTGQLIQAPGEQFVPPAFEVQVPNPDDLRRVFRAAVVDKLGMGWNSDQIEALVKTYTDRYIGVQRDAYEQQVQRERQIFETGTTDIGQVTHVEAPSPETVAEEEVKRRDLAGFQAHEVGETYAPEFFGALGGYV